MPKFDWALLWEACKEPLRVLFLAALPIVATYVGAIPATWAVVVTIILRIIDKYMHLAEPKGRSGGLTGF